MHNDICKTAEEQIKRFRAYCEKDPALMRALSEYPDELSRERLDQSSSPGLPLTPEPSAWVSPGPEAPSHQSEKNSVTFKVAPESTKQEVKTSPPVQQESDVENLRKKFIDDYVYLMYGMKDMSLLPKSDKLEVLEQWQTYVSQKA